jgi:hypothetical protein
MKIKTLKATYLLLVPVFFLMAGPVQSQELLQLLYGHVIDADSHQPLHGANVVCLTCVPVKGISTDSTGFFRLNLPVGRQTISVSHVAFGTVEMKDVMITSGKAVTLNVEMHEQVIQTSDISVRGNYNRWINPMATVSVMSLRSQDAARYAGGYFDPSRMVANFAGVATGNSDEDNEIVIRGNSPRGILWRLEGIDIPNPNHFANGQGATGGGYTAITTDVLSSFDFFTGSFPAEYGNALSGVMDLNLRSGNTEKRENSLMLSILGTEVSAEGPFRKKSENSYLASFRYADFSYLRYLHIYDKEEMSIIPRTRDWAFRANFNTAGAGMFSFFTLGGMSTVGDQADVNRNDPEMAFDGDEYKEDRQMTISGIKHLINLPNNRTYVRTALAYTWEHNTDEDATVDTTLKRTITYHDSFRYPAIRLSSLLNHKFGPGNSVRAGMDFNYLFSTMFAERYLGKSRYDTLINSRAGGWYGSAWIQWKTRPSSLFEANSGLHLFRSEITRELLLEPRWGMILHLSPKTSVTFGTGLHSRLDPLSIYHYRVKVTKTKRDTRNSDLRTSKAFHLTAGINHFFTHDLHLNVEAYYQYLYDVPVNEIAYGQFSILNQSEGLPDVLMANHGKGKNSGVEGTLEKTFSNNYYFLATASLFSSTYKAPDDHWYNTYYNTNFVYNLQAGKEFPMGRYHRHVPGIRFRANYRGGFRYTPVNRELTLKYKKLVYDVSNTYGKRVPDFKRFDTGITYRINQLRYSVTFMADVQNVTNTRNVLRRKFAYQNKAIVVTDSRSIGFVPVLSVKAEF